MDNFINNKEVIRMLSGCIPQMKDNKLYFKKGNISRYKIGSLLNKIYHLKDKYIFNKSISLEGLKPNLSYFIYADFYKEYYFLSESAEMENRKKGIFRVFSFRTNDKGCIPEFTARSGSGQGFIVSYNQQ